ncbi:putative methyltransferase [Archaeoglobus sulfaticallidus PM70-1]|uniref:N(4)-bis(aminopropyl)spermidine synthase n=1 Tax=Archaeoglobus sulfaticallidus PM70-1 TaxID=387631 RepID=N0BF19_9EURY|nr:bis-aminopropyl spermidine synthase family protein [Archaeoglobus sulfaticallidus]AGK60872.1 putative methyltransferase [Archaeoglobus sulfaticallidus PM70-1]
MSERIYNQILQSLDGEKSVYELLYLQDASLPEVFEILNDLQSNGLIEIKDGKARLTEKGRQEVRERGLKHLGNIYCTACEGTGVAINEFFKEILEKYSEISNNRPEAIEKYDQGFISLEGVIRRVEFIYDRGELNSRIFVVGDDDLLSIAASLTGLPKKVVAVDIDERLINFINKTAEEYGLNVEALVYDVQQPFMDEFRKKFDVFVTDPVETIPGLKLFLSRGVSTLKGPGCSGYFGITTLEASRKKWYEIQRMIMDMGFIITDLRRHFNIYPQEEKNFFRFQEKLPIVERLGFNVDFNWYNSTLFRIEAVMDPKPLVEGEMILDEKVYKDDESWATPY